MPNSYWKEEKSNASNSLLASNRISYRYLLSAPLTVTGVNPKRKGSNLSGIVIFTFIPHSLNVFPVFWNNRTVPEHMEVCRCILSARPPAGGPCSRWDPLSRDSNFPPKFSPVQGRGVFPLLWDYCSHVSTCIFMLLSFICGIFFCLCQYFLYLGHVPWPRVWLMSEQKYPHRTR